MDQHPKKKAPFGRDDRSGRSFFRIRHEEGGEEKTARPERTTTTDKGRKSVEDKGRKPAEKKQAYAPSKRSDRFEKSGSTRKSDYPSKTDSRKKSDHPFKTDPRKKSDYAKKPTRFSRAARDAEEVRLNRFIATSGVCSRREADQLIEAGEVTVNGKVVDQLGSKVKMSDEVRLNGTLLRGEKKVYILLNKPKGYVTTVEDPHADKKVLDLLKGQVKERIYPIGRLDKNTTGVLLLTNDGTLTKELTHPSFGKKKIYHVFLDKPCKEEDLEKLLRGIELEDGPIQADDVSYVDQKGLEVGVELHSGRNRIVRRMFESMGYEVVKLDRVYFAGMTKKGLKRGFWRHLTPKEVSMLKSGAYE